jgi:hypothetical protein
MVSGKVTWDLNIEDLTWADLQHTLVSKRQHVKFMYSAIMSAKAHKHKNEMIVVQYLSLRFPDI